MIRHNNQSPPYIPTVYINNTGRTSSPKFGNLFDSIINAATTILPFVTTQNHSAPITTQIDQLVTQLHELQVGFAALSFPQRLQVAQNAIQGVQAIQAALGQLQAGAGRQSDAAYLNSAKQTATAVLASIQQLITEAQTGTTSTGTGTATTGTSIPTTTGTDTQAVTLPNGQVVYVPVQTTTPQATDNTQTYLLLGGAAVVAYLLLKK